MFSLWFLISCLTTLMLSVLNFNATEDYFFKKNSKNNILSKLSVIALVGVCLYVFAIGVNPTFIDILQSKGYFLF